ncbi:S-adenosylmethionine decarboxylase [Patescibacteria group bacterium]|nr:S-adenosylmethionine decarboxylase [Patescibacteria group bacterium]MBU4466485.1 S-adenosylmethionine decarboxylase [Patescibacteria group bacterium]
MITQRFHYIFDAWGISPKNLNNKRLVDSLLKGVSKICKMRIIGGPLVVQGMDYNPGISGFCIIDFSHISIHTFSNPGEVCVDIFSCKPFDPKEVKGYLSKKLGVSQKNLMFFQIDYPVRNPQSLPARTVAKPIKFKRLATMASK